MRARLSIDKTKAWADWADEEEEAVTPIVTFASKVKLKLGSDPEKMLYKSVDEPLHFAADMRGEQPSPQQEVQKRLTAGQAADCRTKHGAHCDRGNYWQRAQQQRRVLEHAENRRRIVRSC